MSLILKKLWARQPQTITPINVDHSVFEGNKVACFHTMFEAADKTANKHSLIFGTAVIKAPRPSGTGRTCVAAVTPATNAITFNTRPNFASGEAFTMFVRFIMPATGAAVNTGIFVMRGVNPKLGIYVTGNGGGSSGDQTFVPYCRDNASTVSSSTTGVTVAGDGREHTCMVKRDGTNWYYSVDGGVWTIFTNTPANGQGALTIETGIWYGTDGGGQYPSAATILCGGIVRGNMSDKFAAEMHKNPWQVFNSVQIILAFASGGGVTTTINSATFALTAAAVGSRYNHATQIASAAFTITAAAIGSLYNHKTQAATASFTLTPSAVGSLYHHKTKIDSGSFALTASAVGSLYHHKTPITSASFTLTPSAVTSVKASVTQASSATFTLTPSAAGSRYHHRIAIDSAVIVLTASAINSTYNSGAVATVLGSLTAIRSNVARTGRPINTITARRPGSGGGSRPRN